MKLEVGGSRNTKGLCVQLRNVFSKATGSYERVIRRVVAHTCPASRGQEVLRMQEARHPCGEQKAWRREQGKRRCWARHESDRWEACWVWRGRESRTSGSGMNSHFPPEEKWETLKRGLYLSRKDEFLYGRMDGEMPLGYLNGSV